MLSMVSGLVLYYIGVFFSIDALKKSVHCF